MDISYAILKLKFNPTDISDKEVYYQIKDEKDSYGHMALISDYYTNGNRTIVIMYDDCDDDCDDDKLTWIVAEFTNRNDECIASEFFKDYKSARKFFKEII